MPALMDTESPSKTYMTVVVMKTAGSAVCVCVYGKGGNCKMSAPENLFCELHIEYNYMYM